MDKLTAKVEQLVNKLASGHPNVNNVGYITDAETGFLYPSGDDRYVTSYTEAQHEIDHTVADQEFADG